jgi:uncharacterized protein (TIGR03435 family)
MKLRAGCAYLSCILFAALNSPGVNGQSPSFEVAAIKASAPSELGSAFGGIHHGTFRVSNVPLRQVLAAAYGMSETRVIGPDWLDKSRFDIIAKSPPGAPDSQLKPMLQSLLKERFKLTAHLETREIAVYNLVIAKGGVKMPVYAARDRAPDHPNDDRNIRGFPMIRSTSRTSQFADVVARIVNRPVIDRTGLTERYSIFLSYAPMSPQASDKVQDFGPPDIFIALQEQLGLKLERGKDNIDVAVIDHIEPEPTVN